MNDNTKKVMFSSDRDDWETPGWLIRRVQKEFGPISLDAAASHSNFVCDTYFTQAEDGFQQDWEKAAGPGGLVWLNPPYGRTNTPAWIEKALTSVLDSTTGLHAAVLIPARTETKWFHEFCVRGDLYFLQARIKFCLDGESDAGAPFPSVLVHFTKESVTDYARAGLGAGRAAPHCYFVDWRE